MNLGREASGHAMTVRPFLLMDFEIIMAATGRPLRAHQLGAGLEAHPHAIYKGYTASAAVGIC